MPFWPFKIDSESGTSGSAVTAWVQWVCSSQTQLIEKKEYIMQIEPQSGAYHPAHLPSTLVKTPPLPARTQATQRAVRGNRRDSQGAIEWAGLNRTRKTKKSHIALLDMLQVTDEHIEWRYCL
jgi:hypothetical protein